jgi:hypothetical protein
LARSQQQAKWSSQDDETAKAMIRMERQWAEADCNGNLSAESTLADDFEGTAPHNSRYTKAEQVQETKSSKHQSRESRLGEVRVHFFGENVAVLYGSESRVEKAKTGKRCASTPGLDGYLAETKWKWQVVAAQDNWAEKKQESSKSKEPVS